MSDTSSSKSSSDDWISPTPPIVGGLCMCCGLPAFFLLARAGQPERGIVAAFAIGIVLGVVVLCRKLRTRVWFWAFILFAVMAHVLIVYTFKFPRSNAPFIFVAWPFVFIDAAVMMVAIKLMVSLFKR